MFVHQGLDVKHFLDFSTASIGTNFDVASRLRDLKSWEQEWCGFDSKLYNRVLELDQEARMTKEKKSVHYLESKIAVIGLQRIRFEVLKIRAPLELSKEALDGGSERIWNILAPQYARMSRDERELWVLNNLYFLKTSDVQNLVAKFKDAMEATEKGERQNTLVGGQSGNGKSRTLNWIASLHLPQLLEDRTIAHVVCAEPTDDDKSTKSLLQQAILYCGDNYVDRDRVPQLFAKWSRCVQVGQVLLLLVDEVNHLHEGTQRRRLLEITNRSKVSIIGTAVDPLKFREGDSEISGRFHDYYSIKEYKGDRLIELLSLIDLILPFPKRSFIGSKTLKVMENGQITERDGVAMFIEKETKGSLCLIMKLIKKAALSGIESGKQFLTPEDFKTAWKTIQWSDPDKPIDNN